MALTTQLALITDFNNHWPPHKEKYILKSLMLQTHTNSHNHTKWWLYRKWRWHMTDCACVCVCMCVFSPCSGGLCFFMSVERSDRPLSKVLYREKTFNFGRDAKTDIIWLLFVRLPVGNAKGDRDGRLCDADGMWWWNLILILHFVCQTPVTCEGVGVSVDQTKFISQHVQAQMTPHQIRTP